MCPREKAYDIVARFLWPEAPQEVWSGLFLYLFFFLSYLGYLCQKEFAKEPNLFMASQPMKNAGSLEANYWFHGNIYHKS